ncbi:MAG: hypothetical protein IT581_00730 [Verrucomicrobiales bacterium]|nr:hypothetical protein [Verrucomicrobiales bacterium]
MKNPRPLLRRLITAARAALDPAPAADAEPPPGFATRVLQRRRQMATPAEPSFATLLRNVTIGAAAAVLCLALGIGFVLQPSDPDGTDDNLAVQSQIESWVTLL